MPKFLRVNTFKNDSAGLNGLYQRVCIPRGDLLNFTGFWGVGRIERVLMELSPTFSRWIPTGFPITYMMVVVENPVGV